VHSYRFRSDIQDSELEGVQSIGVINEICSHPGGRKSYPGCTLHVRPRSTENPQLDIMQKNLGERRQICRDSSWVGAKTDTPGFVARCGLDGWDGIFGGVDSETNSDFLR